MPAIGLVIVARLSWSCASAKEIRVASMLALSVISVAWVTLPDPVRDAALPTAAAAAACSAEFVEVRTDAWFCGLAGFVTPAVADAIALACALSAAAFAFSAFMAAFMARVAAVIRSGSVFELAVSVSIAVWHAAGMAELEDVVAAAVTFDPLVDEEPAPAFDVATAEVDDGADVVPVAAAFTAAPDTETLAGGAVTVTVAVSVTVAVCVTVCVTVAVWVTV